jgi:hypothetical protein
MADVLDSSKTRFLGKEHDFTLGVPCGLHSAWLPGFRSAGNAGR